MNINYTASYLCISTCVLQRRGEHFNSIIYLLFRKKFHQNISQERKTIANHDTALLICDAGGIPVGNSLPRHRRLQRRGPKDECAGLGTDAFSGGQVRRLRSSQASVRRRLFVSIYQREKGVYLIVIFPMTLNRSIKGI